MCQTWGMVAEYWHDGSKSGDGRGGGAGPLHWHKAIMPEELRPVAAAKLCGGFAVTSLRCRKHVCSFTPSAEPPCHVGMHMGLHWAVRVGFGMPRSHPGTYSHL